jgi:hypothetical protein
LFNTTLFVKPWLSFLSLPFLFTLLLFDLFSTSDNNSQLQKIVKNVSLNCFLGHFRKLNTVQDVNEQEDDTFKHVDVNNVSNWN